MAGEITTTVVLEGLEQLEKEINRRLQGVKNASPKALTDVALDLLGRSVDDAPVDLGDLRGSGYANVNGTQVAAGTEDGGIQQTGSAGSARSGDNEAEIGFSVPYAVIQHEELDYDHPKGGKAKYLEENLSQNMDKYVKHIADSIEEGLR